MLMHRCDLVCLFFITGILAGCGDAAYTGSNNDDEMSVSLEKVSQLGATVSHTDERRGKNCMDCHYDGNNSYVYTVAGTVYQLNNPTAVYPNAIVKFYSAPEGQGQLVALLQVDANGNFYTTQPVDFSQGVYPAVESSNGGEAIYMNDPVTRGDCNSCHGSTTQHVYLG